MATEGTARIILQDETKVGAATPADVSATPASETSKGPGDVSSAPAPQEPPDVDHDDLAPDESDVADVQEVIRQSHENRSDDEEIDEASVQVGTDKLLAFTVGLQLVTMAFDVLVTTVQNVDNELQELVRRAAQYDAGVAMSAEMSDIKLMLAEMRRAQVIGPELSEFADARSDLSVALKDLYTLIAKDVLPFATEIAKDSGAVVKHLGENYEVYKSIYLFLEKQQKAFMHPVLEGYKAVRDLRDWFVGKSDDKTELDLGFDEFKRFFMMRFDDDAAGPAPADAHDPRIPARRGM